MSDSIKITMNSMEYNAVYAVVSSLTGTFSKVAATKTIDLITNAVKASSSDEGKLPEKITVEFARKVLDGLYFGLTEKVKDEKINAQDVMQLKQVSAVLKMKGRFEKFIDTEIENITASDEEFDLDEVSEPLDGE